MSSYGRRASTQVDATTHGPYRAIVDHVEVGYRVAEVLECGHRGNEWPESRTAADVHADLEDAKRLGIKVPAKRRCAACLQVANRDARG